MALARLVTFVPLTLIKSADVNGEFNNILNNPVALISPSTGAINFNAQAHTGLVPGAVTASSGSPGQVLIASTAASSVGQLVSFGGSRVRGLVGTLTSQTGTFVADQYTLQSTAGIGELVLNSTASFVVNLGATSSPAANGRDVAAAFASTYIHWYAITTGPNSTTPAGLVSSSPPPGGPVMPSSYSLWAYLGGSIYSSASTTVSQTHRARGAWWSYDAPIAILTNGASTAETAISLTPAVPINALNYQVETFHQDTGTSNVFFTAALRVITAVNYSVSTVTIQSSGGVVTDGSRAHVTLPTTSLAYQITASGTNPLFTVAVQRYENPNGDA